ncbi:unnamed protein product, partial [Hapterophycus canaliculatus]
DTIGGHGTWTAGSAAGSISASGAFTETTCYGDELPGCAGGCIAASEVDTMLENGVFDIDLYCPSYDCDGTTDLALSYCLSDDPVETLDHNGGVAPGAQISLFDPSYTSYDLFIELAGNLVWESSMDTGARIHSNSWGAETFCQLTEMDLLYDTFMYENPEHLLIFAAGNSGGYRDVPGRQSCTIISPALAKNTLAVGATSSGASRATDTADIDTLAWFSSYGPTADSRIKPEVVAPGDQVFSAWSDGTDDHSCRLLAGSGTSGSCPLVAGAAALVRVNIIGNG